MYFKTEENEQGDYCRETGKRFSLHQCRRVRPAHGWALFETLEEYLAAQGLRYAPVSDLIDEGRTP